MDKAIAGIVLICIMFFILAVSIVVINFFLYDDVEEIDNKSEEAINTVELKKQLLGTLHDWIMENQLTKLQVSEQLKIRRVTTENILLQKVDKFSIDRLIVLLHRAGVETSISTSS